MYGNTPLQIVTNVPLTDDNRKVADLLLAAGADADAENDYGVPPWEGLIGRGYELP